MIFGLIEFGRGIDEKHSMSTLSREAALLAARGTSLDSVDQTVIDNGADIKLSKSGGAIASEVEITTKSAIIKQQRKSTGFTTLSRIGAVGDTAAALVGIGLVCGHDRLRGRGVLLRHTPLVPLQQTLQGGVNDTLYERAVF